MAAQVQQSLESEFLTHKDYIVKLIEDSGLSAPIDLEKVTFSTISNLMKNLIDAYDGDTPHGHPATGFNEDGSLS